MTSVAPPSAASDRYTIISADCHAGGSHEQYREYLDPAVPRRLRRLAGASTATRSATSATPRRFRNWDNEMRNGQQEADGVVGEVVFPNTVPPFFPSFVLFAAPPKPEDYEHRLAGIRAHNRWLVDLCNEFPERRAGIGQIFLNDIDDAIEDVRWIKEHGLRGGVLLPNVAPDVSWVKPLYDPHYDRLWEVIQDLERADQRARRHRRARLRPLPRVDAALHQRGAVLLAAPARAVHPVRRVRALPAPAVRRDRERLRLGPRRCSIGSTRCWPASGTPAPPASSATAPSTCCPTRPPSTSAATCGWA